MTLYLKYRPKDFDSLVGQKFVKETLKQAVIQDKLVGAYLFCGPRGTWKTSSARIFAKIINCKNLIDGKPCEKCEVCLGMAQDNLVDIIEIDAASYTWVDNVRDIIEKAKFSPSLCKYKVYIIDEVHMLSKGAFNALLKILEEPPSHLKFILATTELHKIPETILSRCQKYDFKSITDDDVKERLLFIAKNESIQIDQESLDYIVKEAKGGLRNAISLFEQLIYNGEIRFENVIENYGIPKVEIIENFYTKLIQSDSQILEDFEGISQKYNIHIFFKELLFFIRDKMIQSLWDVGKIHTYLRLLETLEEAYIKTKNSFDVKTTFLVWILKCIHPQTVSEKTNTKEVLPMNWEKKLSSPSREKTPVNTKPTQTKEIVDTPFSDEELTPDDLFSVFGEEEGGFFEPTPSLPSPAPQISSSANSSGIFPKENFISTIKNLWGKGSLTMSLRGAEMFVSWESLIIQTKTKIAHKSISDTEWVTKMNEALASLWFGNLQIQIQ